MGDLQVLSAPFFNRNQDDYVDLSSLSSEGDTNHVSPSSLSGASLNEPEGHFFDASLRLINQMFMEEDQLENKPCMFKQCLALQAIEKSFYDALGNEYHALGQNGSGNGFRKLEDNSV